jgi:hypothetical protein
MGGGEAARVLLAFSQGGRREASPSVAVGAPAEQQLASYAVFGSSMQPGVPPVLSLLSSLQLAYPGNYEDGMSPAVHAARMLSAARGVEELSYDGECARQETLLCLSVADVLVLGCQVLLMCMHAPGPDRELPAVHCCVHQCVRGKVGCIVVVHPSSPVHTYGHCPL